LFNAAHSPELSLGGDVAFDKNHFEYFWRTIPGDDVNGMAVAAYIKNQTTHRRVAAMFSTEEAAQENVAGFSAGLKNLGLTLSVNQGLAMDQTSYETEIQRMVAASPEVMVMESDAQTAGVLYGQMKQARNLMPTVLTAGTDNTDFDRATVAAIGEDDYKKNYVKVLQYAASEGPAWEAFDKALMASADTVKDAATHEHDTYSEAAYDNVTMIALAIVAAKSIDPKVFNPYIGKVVSEGGQVVHTFTEGVAALETGKTIDYQGVEGVIRFDAYHNSTGSWGVFEPLTHRLIAAVPPEQVREAGAQ
jgi:branched-chain amino acid transport system substrate-binding protein